jgi:hypothetical protein
MGDSRGDKDRDDDRFVRWQDITRRALDFVNNVLIVLTSGLIAVVLNEAANAATVAHLRIWQLVCEGTAVILLGLSVLAGVVTAANRLQSIRLTTRRMRIEDLYRQLLDAERAGVTGAYWSAQHTYEGAKRAFEAAKDAWTVANVTESATQADGSAKQAQSNADLASDRAQQAEKIEPVQLAGQAGQAAEMATQAAKLARDAAEQATQAAGRAATAADRATQAAVQARSDADHADRDAESASQIVGRPDRIAAQARVSARAGWKAGGSADWDEYALMKHITNLTKVENLTRPAIRTAARECLQGGNQGVVRDEAAIERLQMVIRQWSDSADRHTWWLIRVQLWLFMLGSIFFAIIPIWTLFSAK